MPLTAVGCIFLNEEHDARVLVNVLSVFKFSKNVKIAESDDGVSRKLILVILAYFLKSFNIFLAV